MAPLRLGELKIWSKNTDGSFSVLKSYTLGEDYFVSATGTGKDRYRLKLAGLTEKDGLGAAINAHSFYYEETAALPHRTSLAQDWWGYYNGQTGNTSLIASENVNFLGQGYVVGNANRNPNDLTMHAGMLRKIIYPTGGSTEFDFEPHYYAGGTTTTQQSTSASSGAAGNTTTLLQQTVTLTPTTSGWARVVTFCSNVTDAVPFFSSVSVKKQNDNQFLLDHKYDPAVYQPYNAELSKEFLVYLIGGNTYELKVMSKGMSNSTLMSGAAFSQAQIYWYQTTAGTFTMAGGLRVKEIRDYPNPGAAPIVKIYKYGTGVPESGYGTLLIPTDGLASSKQEIDFIYSQVAGQCTEFCRGQRLVISSRPALDLSSLSGSPVVYEQVTEYEGSTSAPNGKQVSKFDVQVDQIIGVDKAYNNGSYQLNDSWKGGDEVLNTVYKGASTKVKETSTLSSIFKSSSTTGTKVGWAVSFEGCGIPAVIDILTCCNDVFFYYFDYPIYSGMKKVTSSKETQYSSTDPAKFIESQVDYSYSNTNTNHQQLSSKITLDSEGNIVTNKYWYPADYNSIDAVPSLLTKNIIAVPIKEETHLNNQIIAGQVSRLNADGQPIEVHRYEALTPQAAPAHDKNTIVPASGYIKKLDIIYDAAKKINKTQLTNNVGTAYLWGYNNSYPIAMIANANTTQVAATSFEPGMKGNWTYTGALYSDLPVRTGRYNYRLGSGKNITKSLAPGKYKLEYWGQGTINLAGGTITAIRTSTAINGWILYEKEVNVTSTVTLTISGAATVKVDELRIYPVTAQITTYTYDPEKGVTSITDTNNVITYYEYDSLGRLKLAKDLYGNIVKAYDYHFKGF